MAFLLHHQVDEFAQRQADAEAFRCGEASLSYGELSAMSNQLANLLVESGIGPSDRVGIHMGKSLELPIALYGILKAGAAFVPIDPAAPPARVEYILEDCGIRLVVTDPVRARRLAKLPGRGELSTVVGCSAEEAPEGIRAWPWGALVDFERAAPEVRRTEQDLAYIMYTSGSTGTPKGLMHTHHSGLSYASLSGVLYEVGPGCRLGNHSPLHFDMSTFEYLTGPNFGATTVIITEETTMFPTSLATLIEREALTHWYSVPLALAQLLDSGALAGRDCSSLRWVVFGGEPFPPKQLAKLMELWPDARFSNSYGPAEVNQCTYHHVPRPRPDPDSAVPLGEIWPGAEGLVVGADDEPVEPGDTGELVVRAPTMMAGYWARPDLNGRAFLVRQAAPGLEAIYYRTGDLVRQRDDGLLMFLGRKDRQVKVRGYRVELEEVEKAASALDGIVEAAAVVLPDAGGEKQIVVAAMMEHGREASATELRRALAESLPAYAMPSELHLVSRFPRTGSGKIDRGALASELANES